MEPALADKCGAAINTLALSGDPYFPPRGLRSWASARYSIAGAADGMLAAEGFVSQSLEISNMGPGQTIYWAGFCIGPDVCDIFFFSAKPYRRKERSSTKSWWPIHCRRVYAQQESCAIVKEGYGSYKYHTTSRAVLGYYIGIKLAMTTKIPIIVVHQQTLQLVPVMQTFRLDRGWAG